MVQILSGIYKYRQLSVPKIGVRPTLSRLRKTIFDILQEEVQNSIVLDLFAGAGALGLEALSRGAQRAVFVDSSEESIKHIRKNIQLLNAKDTTEVVVQPVKSALEHLTLRGATFTIIFADPPYGCGFGLDVIHTIDSHPLLVPFGSLFIEEQFDKRVPLPDTSTLELISSRKSGRAMLLHYRKKG